MGEFCLFIEFGGSWRDGRGGTAYPRELNEIFSSSMKVALTAMTQRLGITTLSHHSDCGYLRYYYCPQFQRHSTSNSCLLPFKTLARPTHFENQFEVSQQLSSIPRISRLILLFCLENWDSKLSLSPWAENSKTTTQSLIRTDLPCIHPWLWVRGPFACFLGSIFLSCRREDPLLASWGSLIPFP